MADNGKLLERVTFRGREHLNIHRLMLAKEVRGSSLGVMPRLTRSARVMRLCTLPSRMSTAQLSVVAPRNMSLFLPFGHGSSRSLLNVHSKPKDRCLACGGTRRAVSVFAFDLDHHPESLGLTSKPISSDKEYEVCVLFGRPEELRFLNVIERERMITYSIHKWRTGRPHESWFAIPKECS